MAIIAQSQNRLTKIAAKRPTAINHTKQLSRIAKRLC
jgi:hypothetical protein